MNDKDISGELRSQVLQAAEKKHPLSIVGGGSKSFLGCRFEGEAIDVGVHCGIVDYEPNELVMTARAGTRIETIDAAIGGHGQALGFDPPRHSPAATIGGTLACNASGPARPWRGSVRDAVLGIRLINGLGEHLRFGGRVIKNVAGFDVSRLQAGAYGSLGVITEISFKVLPQPESSVTLVHELDAQSSVARMNKLAASPVPISAAAWAAGRQYIRLCGTADAVDAARRALGGEAGDPDIWSQLRDQTLEPFTADDPRALWRLSVKSTAPVMLEDPGVLIDWGGAVRFARVDASLADMSRIAAAAGGHAMRMSHNDRQRDFVQQPSAAVRRLHERLKLTFDPGGIFNPGRLYDWL